MSSNHTHGVSATYGYDDLNRLTSVVDGNLSGSNTTSYTYDNANNVGTVTYPNNIQMQFTYDTLNRVATAISQVSGYSYQRGPTGNLTNVVELGGRTVNWTYDGIYRLTNESVAGDTSGENGAVGYGLDPVGNRTSDSSTISGITPGSWGYNSDDEVSSESYDANGNVTMTGGKSFTYDSENHLMSMTATGTSVSVIYDGDGNRVSKTVTTNGVPTTTLYLVDDLNPTGYAQVVEELSSAGTVERQYTYGLQRINENQPISNVWTASFYGYDGGGNVRQLTSAAGAITDKYEYDAFGNKFTVGGTTPNNYLYRGEQFDADLGLYYLRARYYNPATGRFMSRDPDEGKARDPITLHKYLYADGDSANGIDRTGHMMLETALQTGKSMVATGLFASAYGCGVSLGFTLASGVLFEDYTFGFNTGAGAAGNTATAGSCVTTFLSKYTWTVKVNPVLGWLGCAAGVIQVAQDVQTLLNDNKNPYTSSSKWTTDLSKFDIDLISGDFGCALTYAAAVGAI